MHQQETIMLCMILGKISRFLFLVFLSTFALSTWADILKPVQLPEDEGTHNFQVEWWYYTGHLQALTPDGPRNFAYELTVFQGEPIDSLKGYVAHFALIDLDKKEHHPFQRVCPLASKNPPAKTPNGFKFIFDAGRWLIKGFNGQDRLKAATLQYGIDLSLTATKPAALYGDQGIVDYGPTGKLAYYSRTRMQTTGSVTVPNALGIPEKLTVTGTSWMDHQWGDTGNPNRLGWDWLSIQLTNDHDFMMFHVRNTTTQEIIKTLGYIIDPKGQVEPIPEEKITILGSKPYFFGKTAYPMQFDISIASPFDISLTTKARFPKQRFKTIGQLTPIYWEGSSTSVGSWKDQSIEGQGFTEMAGYE